MARQGLNCTLSYPVNGATRTFRVRIDGLGHGVEMVADESTGRNHRAYYPHKLAPSRFYLRVILVGQNERDVFANWMQRYADYVMNPGLAAGDNFPAMRVLAPSRKFDREGVPLTGFEWGDVIGGMVWNPMIVFETTREPQDTESWAPSKFVDAEVKDMKYFWPMGTQLSGNQVPSGSYTQIIGSDTDSGSDSGQGMTPEQEWIAGHDPDYRLRDSYGN